MIQTPHLVTANTGPLNLLERSFIEQAEIIEEWFEQEWLKSSPPPYGSVDLRNAGFKIAPVDMNLFPAGFNNLNPDFLPLSIDAAKETMQRLNPTAAKILLIPESHTRNLYYWENIKVLMSILVKAGYIVRLGTLDPKGLNIMVDKKDLHRVEPIKRVDNRIFVETFNPDIILLNNDLSDGLPEIFNHIEQPIAPPAKLGWHQRLKSGHFQYYADVTEQFAARIGIDPWLIAPLFLHCGEIDFMGREGESCVAKNIEHLLAAIQKKYDEYDIKEKPFVIVKADAGTYGMAVMTIRDVKEVQSLNRKQRSHMAKTKGNQPVHRVIIQEGVYTFETFGKENAVAEPVVYLWGKRVVGGFYRVHGGRGSDENLNSPGMYFEPLAFAKTCHQPAAEPDECQNRFYVYGVIARLSMLAAAKEILEQTP